MKNRLIFISTCIFLCYGSSMLAQGPGFMGKHFYAKLDMGMPYTFDAYGSVLKPELSLNYIFHKRFSAGVSFTRYSVKVGNEYDEDGIFKLPVSEVAFDVRAFLSSKFIAPVGTYFVAGVSKIKVDFSEHVEFNENVDFKLGITGVKFGFGISRVLFKKLIVDVSTTVGLNAYSEYFPSDLSDDLSYLYSYSTSLDYQTNFSWKVGVGYLIF